MQEILKQSAQEATEASNFVQRFKLRAWKLGFNGEKELDELAMWCIDELKN